MAVVDAVHPAPGGGAYPQDIGSLAEWAEDRRQELAQWATDLHAVRSRPSADRPVRDSHEPAGGRADRSVIIPMVETMRQAAMERLEAEAEAARAEANAVVAAAMQAATALVLSVGDELRTMRQATWVAPSAPLHRPEQPRAVGTPSPPWPELDALGRTALPDPDAEAFGPEVDLRDAAQIYDLFWRDATVSDRPVVDWVRRLVRGPQP